MAQISIEALYDQYATKFKTIYKDAEWLDMSIGVFDGKISFLFHTKLYDNMYRGKGATHQAAFTALIDDIHNSFPEDMPSSTDITVKL